MSWLYSRALVEEYLADTCSDGALFAPSSGNPTPQAYLPPDKMTAFSRPSRFGMTFAPLTDDRGAELLTWYLAASRARTSAQPEKALESTASAADCGAKWHESSVKYDLASSSWKTHLSLWDEALPWFSVTLPKWGSMRDGVCWERMMSERPTGGIDAGLWATPSATDGKRGGCITENMTGVSLTQMVNTPNRWPTPSANDWKGSSKDGQQRGQLVDPLMGVIQAGGQLNPTWVEWLMGWPLGWTDLKPLETDRCHCAQQKHGGF